MITGACYVDLTHEPGIDEWTHDRRRLAVIDYCPDGARVVVDIGKRQFVSQDAITWLHRNAERLLIEVQGTDPEAVARFVRAGRAGDWSVVT